MLGNGDGTFQQPADQFTTSTVSSSPVLADVNGDGNLDLLIQSFPFLQVYLGMETARLQQLKRIPITG